MARHRFGGTADYVIAPGDANTAVLQPGVTVTCWNAPVGGVQYTDLVQTDGTTPIPGGELATDATGAVPEFMGPDTVRSVYLDASAGAGPRRRTLATDIGEDLTAAEAAAIPKALLTLVGDLLVGAGPGAVDRLGPGAPGQLLIADATAPRKLRWTAGWRRRDLPDRTLADTLHTPAPTFTTTQQSTSTISGAQALLAPDTGPFTYLGAGDLSYGTGTPDSSYYLPRSRYPNTYASGQAHWTVEFGTDATVFEVKFKYISSSTRFRLSVDGRPVSLLPQSSGGITAGSSHVLKIDLGSSAPRLIRLDLTTMPFGGVFLGPGATAWRAPSRGGRLAVLGDSISDGSTQNTGAALGTWVDRVGRLLGCTDVWRQSRGGTGYITPGTFATLGNRVPLDITPYVPDRIIVWAGYNDNGGDQTAISAAAAALYTALKTAAAPGADITVIGCYSPTGTPAASITNTDATLRAAAAAAGLPFISPLTGAVYDAAGALLTTQGSWITTANATGYIGADAVHPNDAGHAYLARRIYDALRALMPA